MKIIQKISPNQNDRGSPDKPCMLILHYTGTKTMEEADRIYMTPDQVSPHYMVDRDGSVIQYVDESKRAWHAGKSSWSGMTDINSASIGIEVVNGGHEFGLEEFADIQISVLIELIHDIRNRWPIPDHAVLGHSDIACGRKIDPGEHFPWQKLYENNIGLMPVGSLRECAIDTKVELFSALRQWGYDYTNDPELMVREFRRHYLPQTFGQSPDDREIYAAIYSLFEQKKLTCA